AGNHGLRGQSNGLQSQAANLVDGHRSDARITSAPQCGLPGRILAETGLDDVAEDRFIDVRWVDSGAANGFCYGLAAKLCGGEAGKAALELADGRTDGGENDRRFHDEPPRRSFIIPLSPELIG